MNTAKSADCKVIILANQKGGVAKSASSVNLSAALALKGKKVLMIDADSQGTGSSILMYRLLFHRMQDGIRIRQE